MEYKIADSTDIFEIQKLLEENFLPFQDLELSKVSLIITIENGQIIGCIGLEKQQQDGLLRSFAVSTNYRNRGIGNELFNKLIKKSRLEGVKTLHLLTTTAEKYFLKKNFTITNRNFAPHTIKQTSEFSTICPSNSTYMTLNIKK